jgi:hypothetical protein
MAENSPVFPQILQFFKESTPKKKNKCNAKKKLHRRWREFGHQKAKNKRKTKIGCEEQQEQQETAANRYPPVIIPGILSIRHSLRVFFQINAHNEGIANELNIFTQYHHQTHA